MPRGRRLSASLCAAVLAVIILMPVNSAAGAQKEEPHIQLIASLANATKNHDDTFSIPFSAQLSNEIRDKANSESGLEGDLSVLIKDTGRQKDVEIVSGIEIKNGVIVFKADLLPKTHYQFEITVDQKLFQAEYLTPFSNEIIAQIEGTETNEGEFFDELSDFLEEHYRKALIFAGFAIILMCIGGIAAVYKDRTESKRMS